MDNGPSGSNTAGNRRLFVVRVGGGGKSFFLPVWHLVTLKMAEMRRIRFHDTRHTFASLLLRKGGSPVYVQHRLGHHDISMTVGTCGHPIPGENRQAVNRLDDLTGALRVPLTCPPLFDTFQG